MTIEQKLQYIAETYFSEYGYIFENLYRADERMETETFPTIVATIPTGGEVYWRNGRIYDRENLLLGFFDLVPHDANGEDSATAYNKMKQLGFRFIQKMNESRLFQYVSNWTYNIWCDRESNIATGVFFQVQVEDVGACVTDE